MTLKKWFPIACLFVVVSLPVLSSAKNITLKDAQGNSVGSADLRSSGKGVEIKLDVHDLPPGNHAIHFHQNAKCDGPDFKSAGPHFNPDGKQHGLENPDGSHAGDMTNFTVSKEGKVKINIFDKDVTLGDDSHSLFSNGGTALVIHAQADDMKTDPSGNSGDRIVCGVITK